MDSNNSKGSELSSYDILLQLAITTVCVLVILNLAVYLTHRPHVTEAGGHRHGVDSIAMMQTTRE